MWIDLRLIRNNVFGQMLFNYSNAIKINIKSYNN